MSKRTLVILCAVALAAVVMLLAFLAEPAPRNTTSRATPGPTTRPTGIDPSWNVGEFDPTTRNTGRTPPIQGVGQMQFTRVNEKGQLEIYKGDPITPLPGGWWQMGKPEFTFNLADDRALRLLAQTGKLYVPAEPRSGELSGDVRLDYFDADDPQRKVIIADDSPDLRLRMRMEDVHFDRDLFRLETDGPFHLPSPQFDFVGQRFRLVYSDTHRRVESLQVQKAQWLRIRPDSDKPKRDRQPDATTKPATTAPAATRPADTQPRERRTQYYRAVFPVNVRIESKDAQVDCQQLELIFSMSHQDSDASWYNAISRLNQGDASTAPEMMAAMLETAGSPVHQALTQLIAWTLAQTTQPAEGEQSLDPLAQAAKKYASQTLAPPSPDDVLITWQGALTVTPVTPEVQLAGPEDVLLRMTGRPVSVRSAKGEIVKSASLSYQASAGLLTLIGDGAFPVEMDSPQLGGVLEAGHFAIDQNNAQGRVNGPGYIRAYRENEKPAVQTATAETKPADGDPLTLQGRNLPLGFSITWQEGLDLSFYKRPEAAADRPRRQQPVVQLAALRSAQFQGDVAVNHPQFEVRSTELSMALADPAQGKQSIETLNARGQVQVRTLAAAGEDQGQINCEDLAIVMGVDDTGRLEPQRLVARENVVALTPEGRLKTQLLTAHLNPRDLMDAQKTAATQPAEDGQAVRLKRQPLRQLLAENHVEIETDEPATRIVANRLVTDFGPTETQIELFGLEHEPVRVQREGMLMTGPRVIFTRYGKTLHIPGEGMMEFFSKDPIRLDGSPTTRVEQPASGTTGTSTPATLVTVTWTQAMHFDDRGGAAQFLGNVLVRGSQARESSRLSCEDLRLEFNREDARDASVASLAMSDNEKALASAREVRSIVAREKVVFEAQSMADTGDKPEARVRIVGDLMTFEGQSEKVRVIGPGTMSIEDYRVSKRTTQPATPSSTGLPMQGMVGRGATAFKWAGGLVLDAAHNDMIMDQAVQMIHVPLGGTQPFQLDCKHLVADLQSTGGLGSITRAPTPQLNAVYADGSVRLLTGDRQVTTDHLEYNGKTEVVLLSADAGQYTTISDAKTPVPLTFRQVRWHLKDNRMEGIQPGRGVIPLLRDPRRPETMQGR